MTFKSLKAQFSIEYTGSTEFYLNSNCSDIFDLGGVFPTVSSTVPGAVITVDSLDTGLTGYALNDIIIGQDTIDVYFRYEDDQNNDSLFVFQVFFIDTIPPVLQLERDTVYLLCENELPELSSYIVEDNCDVAGGTVLIYDPLQTLPEYNCGTAQIEVNSYIYAVDFYGNQDTLIQTVFMGTDTIAPTAIVPNDTTVNCIDDLDALLAIGLTDSYDNCGTSNFSIDTSSQITSGSCSGDLTYKRYWTLIDSCGNVTVDSQMITILDDLPPVFTSPLDTIVDCDTDLDPSSLGSPSAIFDECSGVFEVDYQDVFDTLNCPDLYLLTRIWTVSDSCQNIALDTQHIQITDTLAPLFTSPLIDSIYLQCNQLDSLDSLEGPFDLTDACTGFSTDTIDVIINQTCSNTYEIERTYFVEDECSNRDSTKVWIFVTDSIAPIIITAGADLMVSCTSGVNLDSIFQVWIDNHAGAVAADACSQAQDLTWAVFNSGTANPAALDAYSCDISAGVLLDQSIDFVVEDECGNQRLFTRNFIVTDTEEPIITFCGENIVEIAEPGICGATVNLPAPFAIDECQSRDTIINVSQLENLLSNGDPQSIIFDLAISIAVPNTSLNPTSDITLEILLENVDAEGPEEFMTILGEDGTQLGITTAAGMQCGSSLTQLTIPMLQYMDWAIDGTIQLTLQPNIPANLIDGINPICPVQPTASISLNYNATISEELSYSFSLNNTDYEVIDASGIGSTFFEVGLHTVSFRVEDCGANVTTCTKTIEIIDTEAPTLSCAPNKEVFLTADSCQIETVLDLPINIEDNCSPGTLNIVSSDNQFIPYTLNSNLGVFVADTVLLSFAGISSNLTGLANLRINLLGDVDQAGEYFTVMTTDGSIIGTTEIGGTNVSSGSCSEVSFIELNIDENIIQSNLNGGILDLQLISNNPFIPGSDANGINPCDTLLLINGLQVDSVSELSATLSYSTWDLSYFIPDLGISNTVIDDISQMYSTIFNAGEHTVFYASTDAYGNADTCSYQIEVTDTISPVMNCVPFTSITFNSLDLVPLQLDVSPFDIGSFDNCALSTLQISPAEIDCSDVSNGSVIVTLTGTDESGNVGSCTSELVIQETPLDPVYAAICDGDTLFNVVNVCLGDSLFLMSNVSGPNTNLLSFEWINPIGETIAVGANPVIPITDGEDYNGVYSLVVTGPNSCTKTSTFSVSVSDLEIPEIQASITGLICEGAKIDLSISNYVGVSDVTYVWYKGDEIGLGDSIATTSLPTLNLGDELEPGEHCYYVEVSKDCCSEISMFTYCLEIVSQPLVTLQDELIQLCEFDDLELAVVQTSNNPNWIYEWTGPGIPSGTTGASVTIEDYSPNTAGIITIVLEVYDENLTSCAITPLELSVDLLEKPDTPILNIDNTLVCEGAEIDFEISGDLTGVTSFEIIGDNTNLFVSADEIYTLNPVELSDAGNYFAVSIGNGCQSDPSNAIGLTINPDPVAEIISADEICSSQNIYELEASQQPGLNYTWTLPNGTEENGFTIPLTNPISGNYIIEVNSGFPDCISYDTLALVINENPQVLVINDNVPDCYPGPVFELILSYESDPSDNLEQEWSFDDLTSSDPELIIQNPGEEYTGVYTLELIDPSTNCRDTMSVFLEIPLELEIPSAPFTQDEDYVFCDGDTVLFQTNDFINISQYNWNFGEGELVLNTAQLNLQLIDISDFDFGTVKVQYVTDEGCVSEFSALREYEVIYLPELEVDYENSVCANSTIELSMINCFNFPSSSVLSWELPNGDIQNNTCQISDVQSVSGSYIYKYKYEQDGCESDIDSVSIFVKPLPELVDLKTPYDSICLATEPIDLSLDNAQPGVDYALWVNDLIFSDFNGSPGPTNWAIPINTLPPMSEEIYSFELLGALNGCFAEDTSFLEISVFSKPIINANIDPEIFRYCESQDSLNLIATNVLQDGLSGLWSSVNSTDPIFVNAQSPNTRVTGLDSREYYDFVWSLSYGACEDYSQDTVSFYIAVEQEAMTRSDIDTCLLESLFITANPSENIGEPGYWTQPDGQGAEFSSPNSHFTSVGMFGNQTELVFIWEFPDYGCGVSSDTLNARLLNEFPMVEVDFVSDCGDGSHVLNGVEPMDYIGMWSSSDPNIVFDNENLHNTTAHNLVEGQNIFYYEFLDGICGEEYREELIVDYTYTPIAVDDNVILEFAGTNVLIDVLVNDFNADTDLDELIIITEPQHGVVILEQNAVRYFSDQNHVGLDSFKYEMISKQCGNSSIGTVRINIGENSECDFIPNIITPNDDGFNDEFIIPCLPNFPENTVQIFNIWGDKVFEAEGYENDWKADLLPTGTYYYVVRFSPDSEEVIGFLHIQR